VPKTTRMTHRLPLVLSALALVVAVLGATPYAEAHGVFHASELDEMRLQLGSCANGAATLVGVTTLASSTVVNLLCTDGGGVVDVTASDVKIAAVKVETVTAG
jgi:hypothetical protein